MGQTFLEEYGQHSWFYMNGLLPSHEDHDHDVLREVLAQSENWIQRVVLVFHQKKTALYPIVSCWAACDVKEQQNHEETSKYWLNSSLAGRQIFCLRAFCKIKAKPSTSVYFQKEENERKSYKLCQECRTAYLNP